ncbi:MAG TPA: antitoxin Xre-like helix-turn-helix domain-containing protein [Zeimonas sp.]
MSAPSGARRRSHAYPASRFAPPGVVDLGARPERERLSRSALRGFFAIAERWKLRDDDARELLGGISSSTYYEWKKKPERTLEVDRITRISYLVGIYKALHILYGDALADEWARLPNRNALFGGRSPLEYMIAGGLLAMQTVRRLLDARRGGA